MQELLENKMERLPLKERNEFQIFLMKNMLGSGSSNEGQIAWADAYAKKVSEIIDNPENKEIREFIMGGKYEEAGEMVKEML